MWKKIKRKRKWFQRKVQKQRKKIKNTNGKEKVGDVDNGIERRTYFFAFH